MNKSFLGVVAITIVGLLPSAAIAGQHVLSDAERSKVVCVPERTADGAITGGKVCRTGAQWEASLKATKRRAAEPNLSDRGQRGAYLARTNQIRLTSRPTAKPF